MLRAWREAHGLTQEQAAEQLGASLGAIRDWEQNRRHPRGMALASLLSALADRGAD